jgi:hypothetical protein
MQEEQKTEEPKDLIGELYAILQEVGATLTLYGKPIGEKELRQYAEVAAKRRILDAFSINTNRDVAKEKAAFLAAMERS